MILKYSDNIFHCVSSYEERMIPKQAKFRWNPDKKIWWTDDFTKAANLIEFADDFAKSVLVKHEAKVEKTIKDSKASDSNIELPRPEGLNYLGFQKAGIAFGLDRPNVLIADEMGLGKTIQALGIINSDSSLKSGLIICPASLKLNWKMEAEKWLVNDFTIAIADSKTFPETDIVIINFDIVKNHKETIDARHFDILIVDEAHKLKNPKAQRTGLILGKTARRKVKDDKAIKAIDTRRKVFLTGTPILNKPVELFPIANALDSIAFPSFWKYAQTFCGAHHNGYGWDFTGATNLSELQHKLRSTIMVRRLKKDVLKELPSKRRQVIEISANGNSKIVQKEVEAWKDHENKLHDLKVAVELAKTEDEETYQNAVQNLKEGSSAAFTEMSAVRKETAIAKIPSVISHVEDAIEEGKVILFAHHKEVVRQLSEHFGSKARVIVGDTKMDDRQKAVDDFQDDDSVKVIIGSIGAMGVGFTLTASSHVIFAELDWVPGNVSQCEDRAHRIGQENSVLIQHLVLEGSIDAKMARAIVHKQDIIDKSLDDEIVLNKETFDLPTIPSEKTSVSKPKSAIDKLSETLTDEDVLKAHKDLRTLSSMCDGATAIDGMGFNKIDTGIGHQLANRDFLTKKQAALGIVICKKYHRQLNLDLV